MSHHRGNQLNHHPSGDEHHHHDEPCGHYHAPHCGTSELSPRRKLVVRIEHAVQHNSEHATFYEKLADDAKMLEGDAVAAEIMEVARYALRQNEHLKKALAILQPR